MLLLFGCLLMPILEKSKKAPLLSLSAPLSRNANGMALFEVKQLDFIFCRNCLGACKVPNDVEILELNIQVV